VQVMLLRNVAMKGNESDLGNDLVAWWWDGSPEGKSWTSA
jgi:hypothetical protein